MPRLAALLANVEVCADLDDLAADWPLAGEPPRSALSAITLMVRGMPRARS